MTEIPFHGVCIHREASSGARRHLSRDFGSDGLIQIKFGPVTVGNSIRLASEVELGDALG